MSALGLAGDWMAEAACAGMGKEGDSIFFPPTDAGIHSRPPAKNPRRDPYAAARAICAGCPVRGECLDFALSTNQQFGMWGSMNEEERRRIRRLRSEARRYRSDQS